MKDLTNNLKLLIKNNNLAHPKFPDQTSTVLQIDNSFIQFNSIQFIVEKDVVGEEIASTASFDAQS